MVFSCRFQSTFLFSSLITSCFVINNHVTTAQVCVGENTCRAEPENEREAKLRDTLDELIAWIDANDGYVNPKLEIRSFPLHLELKDLVDRFEDESADSASESEDFEHSVGNSFSFGIYVKEGATIEEGEELLVIPEDLMIFSDLTSPHRFDGICLLAEELAVQRYNHEHGQSTIAPYMELLEQFVFEEVKLPMSWRPEAQNLLTQITTADFFVPLHFYQECFDLVLNGEDNREARFRPEDNLPYWYEVLEVAQALSRNDSVMVPIYDMISHSNNPKKINIIQERSTAEGEERMTVYAKRRIGSSEELSYSFGLGKMEEDQWNGVTKFGLGTMRMFHDYGFVEGYPQRWYFPAHMIDFAVDEVFDDATGLRQLQVKWNSNAYPDHDAIYTVQALHDRLAEIKENMNNWWDWDLRPDFVRGINPQEVKRTYEFLCNYLDAVYSGLMAMKSMHAPNESVYTVEEETVLINNMDSIYFQTYQCNDMIVNIADGYFQHIESLRSAYQKIAYFLDPVTNDRCLYLDGVYQQCISYWPHYHELVVHKPAKYLKEGIKRVLWVGGGDSGPLNEFLKYPTLELAVGLELDQQVTRLAYKHFASRPHYDDPRVQWWYGDASKSLLMLPKDYFGSFDLIIVDLSDTVFSLSVSAELDVIEAISLLLRPGGIFEMNELFMRKVSNVFEHAIHYNFNDVPKILDQAAIFASNDVNFLNQELTEHELLEDATILVENDSMLTKHQFDRVHDYRHNPNSAFARLCKKMQPAEDHEMENDDKPQTTAPGIMMIVEAENLTVDLSSPSVVQSSIIDIIEGLGLTVVSDKLSSLESPWFVIVMKEGYVVVRLWAGEKYCALDIHLWNSFDSHEDLKKAIVIKALGGDFMNKSTSSYRIVAGGMFGMPNWKEESKKHGPQLSRSCVEKKDVLRDQESPLEVKIQALELSLEVLQGSDLTAVVVCGPKEGGCPFFDVLMADSSKFERVIPLNEATVSEGSNRMTRIARSMNEAKEILDPLLEADPPIKVDAIFYDISSTVISNEVVSMMNVEHRIRDERMFFVTTTDSQSEIWRRRVLSSFRDEYDVDPLFRGQVLLNTTTSSFELSILVAGNPMFMKHLTEAVAESQAKNPDVTLEIRNIMGGSIRLEKQAECNDANITHVSVAEDYNHDDARSQWETQTPVATQTLLQFSNSVDGTPTLLTKTALVLACTGAFAAQKGASMKVYDDFGGDGAICAGAWETGTAVVSWDGRYGVDLNIFSILDLPELQSFEKDIKTRLTSLGGWLRDIQPRGYGRVVSFKHGMLGKASFFTDDELEKEA